jgi:hypothetical protein
MSAWKPGAEVLRFSAEDVRVLPADFVAPALQDIERLQKIAEVLRSSGLVQVNEGNRTFGMHQLLQQAVGRELEWKPQCDMMKALLHVRCGQFGDENYFDCRLFGVMRELLRSAVAAVERIRSETDGQSFGWCSGMLLRLCELARQIYGYDHPFSERIFLAAHGSLVADLVLAHIMMPGCPPKGRSLFAIANVPNIQNVTKLFPNFDLCKCLAKYWSVGTLASENGVRVALKDGSIVVPADAKTKWHWDCSVDKHLRSLQLGIFTLALVFVDPTLVTEESVEIIKCKIADTHHKNKEDIWGVSVTLGAADHLFRIFRFQGRESKSSWQKKIDAHECALRWRLDTLGELHPSTATTLSLFGIAYHKRRQFQRAIKLKQRALRIATDLFGKQHPFTAQLMISLGLSYGDSRIRGVYKFYQKEMNLHRQALLIYETTMGKDHPFVADVLETMVMAQSLDKSNEEEKTRMKQRALAIREKTGIHKPLKTIDDYNDDDVVFVDDDDHDDNKGKVLPLEPSLEKTTSAGFSCPQIHIWHIHRRME